ncbi:hypothetical protein PC129_g13361 [Phytophthora cactorum]|uniref:Uncharacterized protein n=1 Tax=Phytophthora cactorum TaxID=29920 RepID=A0A8T1HTE0_9STRA|nr:hypothetical protein PC129_g13361 [Phytophthora cactorum]
MTPIALDRLGQLESRVCDLEESVGDLQQLLRQNNHNY